MSAKWVSTRTEEICPECGAELQCLAGSSAHPTNWHCSKNCGLEAWSSTKPAARVHQAKPAQPPKEPTQTERLQRKLAAAVWICSFGEQCGIKAKHQLTDIPLEDIHVRKEAAELLISALTAWLKEQPLLVIEQIETQQRERLDWLFQEPLHSESSEALSLRPRKAGDGSHAHEDPHHPNPPNIPTDK